jgi:hypothetical protein
VPDADGPPPDLTALAPVAAWIRRQHARGTLVYASCSGVFLSFGSVGAGYARRPGETPMGASRRGSPRNVSRFCPDVRSHRDRSRSAKVPGGDRLRSGCRPFFAGTVVWGRKHTYI